MKVIVYLFFCMKDEKAYDIKRHVDPLEEMGKILLGPHFKKLLASK